MSSTLPAASTVASHAWPTMISHQAATTSATRTTDGTPSIITTVQMEGAIHAMVQSDTHQQDRLLFDSGAAVHACPLDYATEYPLGTNGSLPLLRTVTGETITVHGTRTVHYQLDAHSTITIQYVVADVSMPALSVSRLLKLG